MKLHMTFCLEVFSPKEGLKAEPSCAVSFHCYNKMFGEH